jgi:transposase InsO family protein
VDCSYGISVPLVPQSQDNISNKTKCLPLVLEKEHPRIPRVVGHHKVLIVVDDYSRYAWVFFLEDKGETFGFVRDLVLSLRNERHGDAIRAIRSDNGSEFRNSRLETFCHDMGLEH